jgi:hypothetical protein
VFFCKNVILQELFAFVGQECDSKRFADARDSNATRPLTRPGNLF